MGSLSLGVDAAKMAALRIPYLPFSHSRALPPPRNGTHLAWIADSTRRLVPYHFSVLLEPNLNKRLSVVCAAIFSLLASCDLDTSPTSNPSPAGSTHVAGQTTIPASTSPIRAVTTGATSASASPSSSPFSRVIGSLSGGPRVLPLTTSVIVNTPPPVTTPVLAAPPPMPAGLDKIEHFVFIMQENRSFDEYFGTYPGADGIPPGVCLQDPNGGPCVAPYHDTLNNNRGGPHDWD